MHGPVTTNDTELARELAVRGVGLRALVDVAQEVLGTGKPRGVRTPGRRGTGG